MKITSLRIRMLKNTGNKMQGVASITLDNMIAIHGVKILKSQDGFFLAMPSRTIKPGQFEDVVHPVNADVRAAIENIVFRSYEFCAEQNLHAVQLNITDDNRPISLLDQNFNDFQVTVKKEDDPTFVYNPKTKENTRPSHSDIPKSSSQDEAFWNWLNN